MSTEAHPETQVPVDKSYKTIKVSGIPYKTNRDELEDMCSTFGRVLNIKMMGPQASVLFMTHEDADFAIYRLNGRLFKGVYLKAAWAEKLSKEQEQQIKDDAEKKKKRSHWTSQKEKGKKTANVPTMSNTN